MVHLAMRMHCNWAADHAINHSSIGLNQGRHRGVLELDCFCLANIVAEDILGHKMLLPRTFSATSKLLPSTFSTQSKLLRVLSRQQIIQLAAKVLDNNLLVAEKVLGNNILCPSMS